MEHIDDNIISGINKLNINNLQKEKLNMDKNKKLYDILDSYKHKDPQIEKLVINNFYINNTLSIPNLSYLLNLKDFLSVDFNKISLVINKNNNNDILETIDIINYIADKCSNKSIYLIILLLFGLVNKDNLNNNSLDKFVSIDNKSLLQPIENYTDSKNYLGYFEDNYKIIIDKLSLKDFNNLINTLSNHLFVDFTKNTNKYVKSLIIDHIYKMNKILILLCGSGYLWLKTNNSRIKNTTYDNQINKFNKIFWNNSAIKSIEKLVNHPRVQIGFISSMLHKNINGCIEALKYKYDFLGSNNNSNKSKPIVLSQIEHIDISLDEECLNNNINKFRKNSLIPSFKRSIKLIKNATQFDESNILILDLERDKVYDNNNEDTTINNTLFIPLQFSEKNFYLKKEESNEINKKYISIVDDIINNIIDNCQGDIRESIAELKKQNKYC